MSAHDSVTRVGKQLCDDLHRELLEKLPGLARNYTSSSCGFYLPSNRNRYFAYAYHTKTLDKIEVWCKGNARELEAYSDLDFRERKPTTGGWARYQGRFKVDDVRKIPRAVELLSNVSFPQS